MLVCPFIHLFGHTPTPIYTVARRAATHTFLREFLFHLIFPCTCSFRFSSVFVSTIASQMVGKMVLFANELPLSEPIPHSVAHSHGISKCLACVCVVHFGKHRSVCFNFLELILTVSRSHTRIRGICTNCIVINAHYTFYYCAVGVMMMMKWCVHMFGWKLTETQNSVDSTIDGIAHTHTQCTEGTRRKSEAVEKPFHVQTVFSGRKLNILRKLFQLHQPL